MLQIEWTYKGEEAMYLVHLHMGIIKVDKKKELNELYSRLIFPRPGHSWGDVKRTTIWGVILVTMWDKEHLLYAMVSILGQG